jgi:hypothetical protein
MLNDPNVLWASYKFGVFFFHCGLMLLSKPILWANPVKKIIIDYKPHNQLYNYITINNPYNKIYKQYSNYK